MDSFTLGFVIASVITFVTMIINGVEQVQERKNEDRRL